MLASYIVSTWRYWEQTSEVIRKKLAAIVEKHGGLIFGVDALQPEGHGSLLYVLYEILSGTVVSAIQLESPNEKELTDWLMTYQDYRYWRAYRMVKSGS